MVDRGPVSLHKKTGPENLKSMHKKSLWPRQTVIFKLQADPVLVFIITMFQTKGNRQNLSIISTANIMARNVTSPPPAFLFLRQNFWLSICACYLLIDEKKNHKWKNRGKIIRIFRLKSVWSQLKWLQSIRITRGSKKRGQRGWVCVQWEHPPLPAQGVMDNSRPDKWAPSRPSNVD